MEEETEKQIDYRPWLWKKGQSGNPKGRPKGKTLKEWVRERIATMTEEEKDAFLTGMPKDKIWAMAEGLPQQDITSAGEKITIPIYGGKSIPGHNSNKKDIPTDKKNKSS